MHLDRALHWLGGGCPVRPRPLTHLPGWVDSGGSGETCTEDSHGHSLQRGIPRLHPPPSSHQLISGQSCTSVLDIVSIAVSPLSYLPPAHSIHPQTQIRACNGPGGTPCCTNACRQLSPLPLDTLTHHTQLVNASCKPAWETPLAEANSTSGSRGGGAITEY